MAKDLDNGLGSNGGDIVASGAYPQRALEELAPGCRPHPGRAGFDEYRGDVSGSVVDTLNRGDTLDMHAPCAQEIPNWRGTAPAPGGNLDNPSQ